MKRICIALLFFVAQMSALDLQTALGNLTTSLNDLRDALAGSKKNVPKVVLKLRETDHKKLEAEIREILDHVKKKDTLQDLKVLAEGTPWLVKPDIKFFEALGAALIETKKDMKEVLVDLYNTQNYQGRDYSAYEPGKLAFYPAKPGMFFECSVAEARLIMEIYGEVMGSEVVNEFLKKTLPYLKKFGVVVLNDLLPVYKLVDVMQQSTGTISPDDQKKLADLIEKLRKKFPEFKNALEGLSSELKKHELPDSYSAYAEKLMQKELKNYDLIQAMGAVWKVFDYEGNRNADIFLMKDQKPEDERLVMVDVPKVLLDFGNAMKKNK